jgi:hypothetical protein
MAVPPQTFIEVTKLGKCVSAKRDVRFAEVSEPIFLVAGEAKEFIFHLLGRSGVFYCSNYSRCQRSVAERGMEAKVLYSTRQFLITICASLRE